MTLTLSRPDETRAHDRTFRFAWRASRRIVGWEPAAWSLAVIVLLLVNDRIGFISLALFEPRRIVETVIPLAMGLQAAFAFSPRDEPALEVILSAPRRLIWLLVERLAVIGFYQALAACIGMGIVFVYSGGHLVEAVARWVSPSIVFVGVAVYVTLVTNQAVVSVVLTILAWWAFGFLGDALVESGLPIWPLSEMRPVVRAFHVFLQPDACNAADYLVNRVALVVVGLGWLALAFRLLGNTEHFLLGQKDRR
jgi:hypothetical protein